MGLNMTIGQAVFGIHDDELPAFWTIERCINYDSPHFYDAGQPSNSMSGSHIWWDGFIEGVKLQHVFLRPSQTEIPYDAMFEVTQELCDTIRQTRLQYWRPDPKPPGFTKPGSEPRDGWLAGLIWIDWWVHWALANCSTPFIKFT